MKCGRAAADYKLAYSAHQVKFDVDNAHYDEKEFNLRANMAAPSKLRGKHHELILDSRLDQSAALQAVTLSVDGIAGDGIPVEENNFTIIADDRAKVSVPGFDLTGKWVENVEQYGVAYRSINGCDEYIDSKAPFVTEDIIYFFNTVNMPDTINRYITKSSIQRECAPWETPAGADPKYVHFGFIGYTNKNRDWMYMSDWVSRWSKTMIVTDGNANDSKSTDRLAEFDISQTGSDGIYCFRYNESNHIPYVSEAKPMPSESLGQDEVLVLDTTFEVLKWMRSAFATAVQIHNHSSVRVFYKPEVAPKVPTVLVKTDSLSYDTARITDSQLQTIHTFAMRNLTRGDYTHKEVNDVKEAKAEVAELASDIVAKEI
jgi:hypothetical protein